MNNAVVGPPHPVPSRATALARTPLPATTIIAAAAVALIGMNHSLVQGLTIGTIAAVALAPLWWRSTGMFRDARLLILLAVCALLSGAWLTDAAGDDHHTSSRLLLSTSLLVVNAVLGAVVVMWARTRMSDAAVAVAFGAGMLLGVDRSGRFAENPWRFGYSIPLIVLLLGLTWLSGRGMLQVIAALGLAVASAASGGRSTSAMLVLAAVVTLQQLVGRNRSKNVSRARAVILVGALSAALYYFGQAAILDGFLGEDAQERTQEQIELSGSIITGARPESGATLSLAVHRPYGFGAGTLPNTADLLEAKTGMAKLNYDPDNGYVERYMFGDGIELHSTAADLWAGFGLAGLALAGFVLWIVLRGYTLAFSRHIASALLTYLAIRALWNLLFSPLSSSVTLIALTVGLLVVRRDPSPGKDQVQVQVPVQAHISPVTHEPAPVRSTGAGSA